MIAWLDARLAGSKQEVQDVGTHDNSDKPLEFVIPALHAAPLEPHEPAPAHTASSGAHGLGSMLLPVSANKQEGIGPFHFDLPW